MELGYNPKVTLVPVFATKGAAWSEGGDEVGSLYSKECYVLLENIPNEWGAAAGKIEFVNPAGVWSTGYVTLNGSGLALWFENPNAIVNGNPRYIVKKSTNIYDGGKNKIATLNPGDYVYTRPGSALVGASEHDWMQCFAYKKDDVYHEPGSTLFVDTQIKHTPTNPHVRGNW